MTCQKFTVLEQLLSCYFHQDWLEEFDGNASVLRAMIKSESKARLAAAALEIDALLSLKLSDAELEEVLVDQLGCYFDPTSKGISYSQWLQYVRYEFSQP